jgi:hypothetical protein
MSPDDRRGPSRAIRHRVLIRRRAMALCLVFLLVAGVIGLVKAVVGGSSPPSAANPAGGGVTSTTPSESSTSPRPPAGGVLLLGDSDAVGLAGSLGRELAGRTLTTVAKSASGLARPDFFDWPRASAAAVLRSRPKVVVVVIGANDGQGLRRLDGTWVVGHAPTEGDAAWKAEYSKRVAATMDSLSASGRLVVWVGVANHPSRTTRMRLKIQDGVVRAAAAARHGKVVYVDAWALLSAPDGSYTTSVVDPADGRYKRVRSADGFHLNMAGVRILARAVNGVIAASR